MNDRIPPGQGAPAAPQSTGQPEHDGRGPWFRPEAPTEPTEHGPKIHPSGLLDIDCDSGSSPLVIRAIQDGLNTGLIPGTYVTAGRVLILEQVSGSPENAAGNHPLPVAVTPAGAHELASLLVRRTFTHKTVTVKDKGSETGTRTKNAEFTPTDTNLAAVLAPRSWPGLRPLNGIIGAPVLRPDGTLLQEGGYDPATGLYLASRAEIGSPVPAEPDEKAVNWAKDILLNWVLADFPWCSEADRANFLAMLVTQVIRRSLGDSLVPFFVVTAPGQGSGKTLLVTICGVLFGQVNMPWTGSEDELRKTLTSIMRGQEGVISFDNIPTGTVLRSATLSKLLTDRTWGDRLLGGNVLAKFANDRLWAATGNNLRAGGDMASRMVLISIDPRMEHPERRSGFVITDLEGWLELPDSRRKLLDAVCVLVADWAAAGRPEADVTPMRQFTRWARACGGLLEHHGVPGFLENTAEVEEMDDDSGDWSAVLLRWQAIFGRAAVSSSQVMERSYDPRWEGYFPTGRGGDPLGSKGLGRRLAGERNHPHGGLVLRGWQDRTRLWWWWVEAAGAEFAEYGGG
jgi:hypothetical protein